MKTFHAALANSMAAFLVNTFIWFAVTFWVFLETKSVIATSIMAGVYSATIALSGFFLGTIVDHYPKKSVMRFSSLASLALYGLAALIYASTSEDVFRKADSPQLWAFIVLALFGALAGNLRGITMSTLVTILLPEEDRDKANGLVGTANGVAFLGASIFSGLVVGFLGIFAVFIIAIVMTVLVLVHIATLSIPSGQSADQSAMPIHERIDLRGTIHVIQLVPGLFGLIFFNTFNNFLGGILMSLMDPYGLQLVSVQVWGALWGFLSLGFVIGGLFVTRFGLGKNPLRALFLANVMAWLICSLFTVQSSIVLLTIGLFMWLCLVPVMEAAEQTILQKVVPQERQGRVFGFAQSVEQAASPVTSFIIGPVAQLIFIPFMTTGAGARWIGPWFGTGSDRGLALLFSVAGLIGLVITLIAMRSRAYRSLSTNYARQDQELNATYSAP